VRCAETARLLALQADKVEVVELDELRPGSDMDGLLQWTARQARKHDRIAWVGHAPDVNRLTAALIGRRQRRDPFCEGGGGGHPFRRPADHRPRGAAMAGDGEGVGC